MITVRKKAGKQVKAYRLGETHPTLDRLFRENKVIRRENGVYEIFSREAMSGKGQLAREGDYVKIDSDGFPYPNEKAYFEKNHRAVLGLDHVYEQICQPLQAWLSTEPVCPEVRFLMEHKNLELNPGRPESFFRAPLWGTVETAGSDAVLLFYSVCRGPEGDILDIDFNFVCREEFDRTYDILCSGPGDAG